MRKLNIRWIIEDLYKRTGLAPLLLLDSNMIEHFLNYWAIIAWGFSMALLGLRLFEMCLDMAQDFLSMIVS